MLKNIFIIDDDEAIGNILESLLTEEGYRTTSFLSGLTAIKYMTRNCPDLILLDYSLPNENIESIINGIRKTINADIPIIMMSAHEQAAHVAKKFKLQSFLPKPFQRSLLITAITQITSVNQKNI